MYQENTKHLQLDMFSTVSAMPESQRTMLEESWAGAFRAHCFGRIDESIFAMLYSEKPSRPNAPVNVLVGLEILKSGMGWSDREMYEAFLFDMQVRYALGYENLSDEFIAPRTIYYFRQRLSEYNQEHGVNLLEIAFEAMTDGQVKELDIRTRKLRMDSTQLASDIRDSNRLYLLVEGLRRLYGLLDEEEQAAYAVQCEPYLKSGSKHYTYGIKGRKATDDAVQAVGEVLAPMLSELEEKHANEPVYQTVQRLFDENYHLKEQAVEAKGHDEIGSGVLQSLDDLDATFRRKAGEEYKGYVANITESCDEENDLQLILKAQTASNNTEDTTLLEEAMPNLVERTEVDTMHTDGAYGSPEVDQMMHDFQVELIQSSIRGNAPATDKISLANFVFEQDDRGKPTHATCPQGQRVEVESGRTTGFVARFDHEVCAECPLMRAGLCRAEPQKRNPRYALHFTQEELFRAVRRRRHQAFLDTPGNPRAAVEATIRSVKHPFRHGKLPVRGQFRVSCMVIASAAMCNVRRIHRYLAKKRPHPRYQPPVSTGWPFGTQFEPMSALNGAIRPRFKTISTRCHRYSYRARLALRFLRRPHCRLIDTCFSC